jgi:C-terminal processing protease CtpA/Prc
MPRSKVPHGVLASLLAIGMVGCARAEVAPDSVRIPRLAAAAKVWSAVELFHPQVPFAPGAWDSAFVRTIPLIRTARTRDEYAQAIDALLGSLHDPATGVVRHSASPPHSGAPDPRWRVTGDGILVVEIRRLTDLHSPSVLERYARLKTAVRTARAVVLDLRGLHRAGDTAATRYWDQSGLDRALVRERCVGPATRRRVHHGWAGPVLTPSYASSWRITDGLSIAPTWPGPPIRVIALTDGQSWVPTSVLALQAKGAAVVVSEGPFSDAGIAPTCASVCDSVPIRIRIGDLVMADGGGVRADTIVAGSAKSSPLELAVSLATRAVPPRSAPLVQRALPSAMPQPNAYRSMRFPALEWRVLAAARMWSRVEYFAAYRQLLGNGWNRAFEQALPDFESATDSTAYVLATAHFHRHIEDGHGFISAPALDAWLGDAKPPVRTRYIEGHPVVTSFVDSSAARECGFAIGDVVTSVDGEDAGARMKRIAGIVTASNASAGRELCARWILLGADSTMARIQVRDRTGQLVERRSRRSKRWMGNSPGDRGGPAWRILPGNLGYIDLDRLEIAAVDRAFAALAETRGIVFDMRGYPRGASQPVAERLMAKPDVVCAQFRTPIARDPHLPGNIPPFRSSEQEVMDQHLQQAPSGRYSRPTIMLVDVRTQSAAEHTGLALEAANGTTFVGSQTAGADGEMSAFTIPGGALLYFSGEDVRHADGRQLQQVGLPLAVTATPTIAGIRAGRDEVLEAGIRHLEQRIAARRRGSPVP